MNSNVKSSIVQIERDSLRKLVEEVKETLATNADTGTSGTKQKSFGLVDLWNLRRSMRSATSLRKI